MKGSMKKQFYNPRRKLLCVLGLLCFTFFLNTPFGYGAKNKKNNQILVAVQNGTIYDVFSQIENQTDYRFFYDSNDVSNNQEITINTKSESVNEIMAHVASKASLDYTISNKQIHVLKEHAEATGTASVRAVKQDGRRVTGTIVNEDREALIGVSVAVQGTTAGTITDIDGQFAINVVGNNSVLIVSYLGFIPQEITVGSRDVFDVVLVEDNKLLEEVVVVGYGVQKKVNLTGSIASVNFAEQAESRPVTNVSSALAGLSSGVQVRQSSGRPGSDGADIIVRGVGTMAESGGGPLIIIDGMEGVMDAVNPQDIESISILKDAAAAAIYGSQASNGVILITTKRGQSGKITINYSGHLSYAKPSNLVEMVTNYADYMELMNESLMNIGQPINFTQSVIDEWRQKTLNPNEKNELGIPNYVAYPNTDWQKAIFNSKVINEHNISISGGSDKIRFLTSAGYLNNPGLVDLTGIERFSIRTNVEADVKKWLTVGTRTYASTQNTDPGNFDSANNFLRQTTPGVYPEWGGQYGFPEAAGESATANNVLAFLNNTGGKKKQSRFNTTLFSKITFMEGLTWDFNLNYLRRWDDERTWDSPTERVTFSNGVVRSSATPPDKMQTSFKNYTNYSYTLENLLRYNKTIAKDHDIAALVGYQEYYYYQQENKATKQGLIDPSVTVPGSATGLISIDGTSTDRAKRSVFGRVNYGYKSRYLFEANVRYDGHSRFGKDYRWGTFPSFSGAWRITEEDFMESTKGYLDNLKLRLSWGKLGNANANDYENQTTYSPVRYSFGGVPVSGLAVDQLGNPFIRWESSVTTNIGLDANFLGSRLSFELDLYQRNIENLLDTPSIYLTMGKKKAPRVNVGEMTNKGVEVSLGWNDKIGDFRYAVKTNMAYNKNKVTKFKGRYDAGWVTDSNGDQVYKTNIGDVADTDRRPYGAGTVFLEEKILGEYYLRTPYSGNQTYFSSDGSVNINGGPRDGMIRTEKDMEWLEAMIAGGNQFLPNRSAEQKSIWYGDYIYADENGDGIYGGADDRKFQGVSSTPKYNFGFQLSAAWKGFDVSMNWAGAAGFKLYWAPTTGYNSTATRLGLGIGKDIANNHYFYNPAAPDDPRTKQDAKYPRLTSGESGSQNVVASTNYLFKGDYLKLKNLTVGYTLPKRVAKFVSADRARFYVSGENLWNINSYPGQDPELGSNPGYTSIKQFAFGVNITF